MNYFLQAIARSQFKKFLGIATIATLPLLVLTAGSVRADDCQNSTAMMQTADGKCFDLGYLTVLGRSRQSVEDASRVYGQTAETYKTRPSAALVGTPVTGTSLTSVYTVDVYYPTPEERKDNQRIVQQASGNLQQKTASNEAVERWASGKHQQVMNGVTRSYHNAPIYAEPMIYDDPGQPCYGMCPW